MTRIRVHLYHPPMTKALITFVAILFLVKLCALVWLMSRWADWRWRTLLLCWIAAEAITTVLRMGARTWFAMLLLASVLGACGSDTFHATDITGAEFADGHRHARHA